MRIPGSLPFHARVEFDVVIEMSRRPRPLSGSIGSQLHTATLEIERAESRRKLFQYKPIRNFEELGFSKHVSLRVDYRDTIFPRIFDCREISFPYKFVCIGARSLLRHRGAKYALSAFRKDFEPRLHSLQGIIRHIARQQKELRPLGGIADMVVADAEIHALILDFCEANNQCCATDSVYREKQR